MAHELFTCGVSSGSSSANVLHYIYAPFPVMACTQPVFAPTDSDSVLAESETGLVPGEEDIACMNTLDCSDILA